MSRAMTWSLAAVVLLAMTAAVTVPADAARKREKAAAGGRASTTDSVDLGYVAGHGSPSRIRVGPRRPRGGRR